MLKPKNHTSNNTDNNYSLNGRIMLCLVIILFVALLFIVCFHGYARWFFKRSRRRRAQQNLFSISGNSTTTGELTTSEGLNVCVLKDLPTFVYNKLENDQEHLLECAVCLSEFEDCEEGRVLPKCRHIFHVYCIDMWFHSHSNCPLCRVPVQSSIDNNEKSTEIVLSVIESACSSEPELSYKEEYEVGSSSSSSSSLSGSASLSPVEGQGKSLELVGILVGGYSRLEDQGGKCLVDMGLGSLDCRGSAMLPVGRLFTLKRVWSVLRKNFFNF